MSSSARLLQIAERYVWWSAPDKTLSENLPRLIAQVMEMGTWEDAHELLALVGREAFIDVLRDPPAGVFSPKSWTFWHVRLDMGQAPELKTGRTIPVETRSGAAGR